VKILVNGYFYGGNCPPFVFHLKENINYEVKLTNSLDFLDDYGINSDYLSDTDLIRIRTNFIERFLIKLLKKARIPVWKFFLIRKSKKLLKEFKPDIIINHKASVKAEIMLRTKFQNQLTYIYGSEVHGNRIQDKILDFIFDNSKYILCTTETMNQYITNSKPHLANKIKTLPWGYFEMNKECNPTNDYNKGKLKEKLGINKDCFVFLDTRSLRRIDAGLNPIVNAIKKLTSYRTDFKFIFLRGFLGADAMVNELKIAISNDRDLNKCVLIIDDVVSQNKLLELYTLSDAFISILQADQFGISILDAVFTDTALIISDLPVYRQYLGEKGPMYIHEQNVNELYEAMVTVFNKSFGKIENEKYISLKEEFNPINTFNSITDFLNLTYKEIT